MCYNHFMDESFKPKTETEPKKRILVVDDDSMILEQSVEVFDMLGYEVILAENGKQALDKIMSGEKYDAVVTDFNMPEMNGLDLLKNIRDNTASANIPVILRSAAGDVKLKKEVEKLGAFYMDKPHGANEIEQKLKQIFK